MSKLFSILCLLLLTIVLSACSGSPAKKWNTQEMQRSHSRDAQDELSREMKR